jgi:uncharacterized repeat protein (TIGR03803 family)
MLRLSGGKAAGAISVFFLAATSFSPAQTFSTLANLNNTNGSYPQGALVQGFDGNLYGTADDGGLHQSGTAFKITLAGSLSTVHNFCAEVDCADGGVPEAGLVIARNGNFYGVASSGGSGCSSCGTVFELSPGGAFLTLHSFDGSNGENPLGLMMAESGDFYGTTSAGGNGSGGTVFELTAPTAVNTLYNFEQFNYPVAGVIEGNDGNFYGTAITYSDPGYGILFKMTPGGDVTTLYTFTGANGSWPVSSLVQGTNGNFYGTASEGGPESNICVTTGCGTIFEVTPDGALTTLHYFSGPDGLSPTGALIQGTDGNFYGTTSEGGSARVDCYFGCGTIFRITPGGTFTTLHVFQGVDGQNPYIGLVQATDGNFYGTTYVGGNSTACPAGCGTVFRLSMGLAPFVTTLPTSGIEGTLVKILGNDLTGATSVTFNGKKAKFTIISPTEIATTVPMCAGTGHVEVSTPSATLSSNVTFHILRSETTVSEPSASE